MKKKPRTWIYKSGWHNERLSLRNEKLCDLTWPVRSSHRDRIHWPNSNSLFHSRFSNVPKNMELTVRSLLSASLCQSVVNSTSACRPSVTTSIRRVVISKFCSWSCKSHRQRYFNTATTWNEMQKVWIFSALCLCTVGGHMHSNVCSAFRQSWAIGTSENNLDIIFYRACRRWTKSKAEETLH